MVSNLVIKTFQGKDGVAFIDDLARLRLEVFREYPYLYEGDQDYEKKYLNRYFTTPSSFLVLAYDDKKIIGASTAMHLKDELPEFRSPFENKKLNINDICYFGESVLLPKYRGLGIGKAFMNKRIEFAKNTLGVSHCSFCAVQRKKDNPHKPENYKPLDDFWLKLGFKKINDLQTYFSWKEIGEKIESQKPMQFWMKTL